MEVIQEFRLRSLTNSLYAQFIADVDSQIQRLTPKALKITKCYEAFAAGIEQFDQVFKKQSKSNLTEILARQNGIRGEWYHCFCGHVRADIFHGDEEVRKAARRVLNWINCFKNMRRCSRRVQSANLTELGAKLTEEPLASDVELLGQTQNLQRMIAANEEYKAMSLGRTESRKDVVLNAVNDARAALDEAYRNIVGMVNSQVMFAELSDASDFEGSAADGPQLSALAAETGVLSDFVRSVNTLIREYKTEMAQSGPNTPADGAAEKGEEAETGGEEASDGAELP